MGRIIHPLLALLASATRQELARQVAYLKDENRLLRARLPKKIIATDKEKRRLLLVGKRMACKTEPESVDSIRFGDVVCATRLGGLLRSYSRRAA